MHTQPLLDLVHLKDKQLFLVTRVRLFFAASFSYPKASPPHSKQKITLEDKIVCATLKDTGHKLDPV